MPTKAKMLANNLVDKIENGEIKRKSPSVHTGIIYLAAKEELALYRYQRYLGSLRCMLDVRNMRAAYSENLCSY